MYSPFIKSSKNKFGGYIEDQGLFSKLRYGKYSLSYCGCGVIAVYNALLALGQILPSDLPEIIEHFELSGAVFSGKFGTSPRAGYDYIKNISKLNVKMSLKSREFSQIAEESRVLILTFFNDRKNPFKMLHTVCITKEDGFVVHNSGRGRVQYDSWSELLFGIGEGGGRAGAVCLIGVS